MSINIYITYIFYIRKDFFMNGFIALDVGGTSIKAGVISSAGHLLSPKISHYPSNSHEDLGTLLNHFTSIIIDPKNCLILAKS